jgi:hypothetical protein
MRDGTIAQLVEQRTFNPFVVGSTPAGPTSLLNEIKHLEQSKCFFSVQDLSAHRLRTISPFFLSFSYSPSKLSAC